MLGLILVLGLAVTSVFGCPDSWLKHNGYCYLFSNIDSTFTDAADACDSHNARLPIVESLAKHNWIVEQLKKREITNAWLGATLMSSGKWEWIPSQERVIYTNWGSGEPNNPTTEKCLHIYGQKEFKWNDAACTNLYKFVCEKRSSCNPCCED